MEEKNKYNIKSKCSWCNAKIPKTEKHFNLYGNSCTICSGLFSKMAKGMLTPNGKKVRNYTEEEKNRMIKQRKRMVKLNKL